MTRSISDLPNEIVLEIGRRLSFKDKFRLASTSRQFHSIFQPKLSKAQYLSSYIVQGEIDLANELLKKFPELLLMPFEVKDFSGRRFREIVACEYAYWAKDTYMCRMLARHMDSKTKAIMLKRIDAIESNGLTYEYERKGVATVLVTNSKHFDFESLITALRVYVDGFDDWYAGFKFTAMDAAWNKIGMAQRDLPVHVVCEYCRSSRSFYPPPAFNEETLPRCISFYDYDRKKDHEWFPLVSSNSAASSNSAVFEPNMSTVIGENMTIWRGSELGRAGGSRKIWWSGYSPWTGIRWASTALRAAQRDLEAMIRLDTIRTEELECWRESLESKDEESSHSRKVQF